MAESPAEVAVGALTLAVAGGFLAYAAQITGWAWGGPPTYPLSASFGSAEGVAPGTEVRLAGIRVGTVTGVALDTETFRADMTFAIDAGVGIPEDSSAEIASQGLLGGTFVEVVPGKSPFALDPGAEILDTRSAQDLLGLMADIMSAASGD
ncbi:MAG: outer membrane lipid asymmetry maintenance protein MlaD [Paracoccaceae bacterium]|jgi:phospholipid/cholesterol/gamma-HCH transport system substrate-binding protein|nr:outer membrane lipid asymmetry maintenance protein MlaD [Paracoccaceae bacterium]